MPQNGPRKHRAGGSRRAHAQGSHRAHVRAGLTAAATVASFLTVVLVVGGSVLTPNGANASKSNWHHRWPHRTLTTTATPTTGTSTVTATATTTTTAKASATASAPAVPTATVTTTVTVSPSTSATPTPTQAPAPAGRQPLVGQYRGNPSENPDATFLSTYGQSPALTSSYYTTQAVNLSYESARVKRGTSVMLDLDAKTTPGMVGEVADKSTKGLGYIDPFLTSCETVAKVNPAATVFASFMHEWEVKRAQNVLTNTRDRDPATYAQAVSVFAARAAQIAPDCQVTLWIGGYSGNLPTVAEVMAKISVRLDAVAFDPYVTKSASYQSAVQKWTPTANWFRANADYQAWGSPPIYLGEFGIDAAHGDAQMATFLTDLRDSMRTVGLAGGMLFDRTKTDNNGAKVAYKIDAGLTPLALAAFKSSLRAP